MNVSEQTVKPKNTRVAYHFARYPMDLYDATGKARKVNNEGEEDKALAEGFTENPPAISQTVAVHAMTTQPAIQSGYDALKRELDGKTVEFNVKYAALQREFQALQAEHVELMENHRAALDRIAELVGPPEPAEVEPGTVTGSAFTDVVTGINPFADLNKQATAPKSRAALMADELKATEGQKAKAKAR